MTEFPALRDALVRAAARRRRRRVASAAVPMFAAAAAAVALVSLPGEPPDREHVAPPPTDALEQAFAVFRRAQRPSDRAPAGVDVVGTDDRARTRLLGQVGPTRVFAVPTTIRGEPSLCLVAHRTRAAPAVCGPVSRAVAEQTPPMLFAGTVNAVLIRDDTTDVRLFSIAGQGHGEIRNNALLALRLGRQLGVSWTGASGTRYVAPRIPVERVSAPAGCPRRLDPLPDDALSRARRAALIAVDQLYPHAVRATARTAVVAPPTPCPGVISERSIEVELRLVPKDGVRSASLSEGRLLLGMEDGFMRVYYLLH